MSDQCIQVVGVDQDVLRWQGSGSAVSGSTPFGFFDSDTAFQSGCYAAAIWAGDRLGYPEINIELIDA